VTGTGTGKHYINREGRQAEGGNVWTQRR